MEVKFIDVLGKEKDGDAIIFRVSLNCCGCGKEMIVAMLDNMYEEVQKYPFEAHCKDCSIKKRIVPKRHLKNAGDNFYAIEIQIPAENHKGKKPFNYKAYLTSEHWRKTRERAIENAGGRCQLCNKPGTLHVHHRTYENIGNEDMGDLIALCGHCHAKFHDIID